ncbi:uncharacterized protein LOC141651816 [Silene latifolia]|uniref:uncharacterized protein LOC141651816 n=1 Tax=Silene latifolia TaxID=37657 RepID=UPI003D76DCC9
MARGKRHTSNSPHKNKNNSSSVNKSKNNTNTLHINELSETIATAREAECSKASELRAFNLTKELSVISEDKVTDDEEWVEVGKKQNRTGKTPTLKIDADDVQSEVEFWSSSIYCYVLGVNQPSHVLGGFVRRIWQKYSIDKVSFLGNGVCVVQFGKQEDKELVLQSEHILFDSKPFIIKDWKPDTKIIKDKPDVVPIWVRLYDLELKYWGKAFPKIAGLIGTPIRSDKATQEKEFLNYARYMVEVKIGQQFPEHVEFVDEKGTVQRQAVFYEWKPVLCTKCKGIGHDTKNCKNGKVVTKGAPAKQQWRPKVVAPVQKPRVVRVNKPVTVEEPVSEEELPQIDPAAVVTPMPYQGSVMNSISPAKFIHRMSKRGMRMIQGGPTFMDVLQMSLKNNMLSSLGSGKGPSGSDNVETRVRNKNKDNVKLGLGTKWRIIDNNNVKDKGRIWVLWDPDVFSVTLLQSDLQVVHMAVKHLGTDFSWCCSIVYGCNKDADRAQLWNSLNHMKHMVTGPWLVMGDFNNVMYVDERIGTTVTDAEVRDFQGCVDFCGLYDMVTTGAYYTWNNKQAGAARVFSRIDRVLANDEWILTGPSGVVNFLPEVKKLKRLKFSLKKLNREGYGDVDNAAQVAKVFLEHIQMQVHRDPTNINLLEEEKVAAITFKELDEARVSYLAHKAKIQWVHNADDNTRFFHSTIKARRAHNKILSIKDMDGNVCTDASSIEHAFIDYYKLLLGSSSQVHPVLDKAPGPDGYSSGFFRDAFDIVGEDVVSAIMEFFTSGRLLQQVNATVLTLIPKNEAPATVMEFRPIACCNVLYKCISKVICNRVAKVLPDIISMNQGAFIQDTEIVDNILICHDLVRLYNRKSCSPRVLMKIDLRKAYDSIEWDFLHEMLVALMFPAQMVDWIMQCVTTTSFSMSLNGTQFGYFQALGRVFLLPKTVIHKVESVCRSYLWAGSADSHKVPYVAWEQCCLPKNKGGLGIVNCPLWNVASIGKYTWWVANKKDCLWVKWGDCVDWVINWRCKSLCKKMIVMVAISGLLYCIWEARNKCKVDMVMKRPEAVIEHVQNAIRWRLKRSDFVQQKDSTLAWIRDKGLN